MKSSYNNLSVPADGKPIEYSGGKFQIPDNPIIPFIEGDGTGRDIWKASRRVFDAAVETRLWRQAQRSLVRSLRRRESLQHSSRNGSATTPSTPSAISASPSKARSPRPSAAASARSTSPCASFSISTPASARCAIITGVPSPVKDPERMNVIIFRENTEDVYIGIEWDSGTPEVKKLLEFLNNDMLKGTTKQIRWDSGVGIKPISPTGTKRLVRRAIQYALDHHKARASP